MNYTTSDYLEQLTQDRDDLVDNLTTKGITGLTGDETFTELVPEVLNIPSGGGDLDWSSIGYNSTPQGIIDMYNYSKEIYDNWIPATNLAYKFSSNKRLVIMPFVDTSIATNMAYMFSGCTSLITIPLLDTSEVTGMSSFFGNCASLTTIPLLDTSKVVNMESMFYGCTSLTTIPLLDTSSVSVSMTNMFSNCTSLSNESLNNILQMCINATQFTGTKTLKKIGLSSAQATTCQGLSNYQDFLDAGWTTGY